MMVIMAKLMRKIGTLAVLAGVLALSGCAGGSGDSDAAATPEAEVSIVTEVPTAKTDVVNELERDQAVNEFRDAAKSNANCTSFECKTAEAAYSRYQNLYELAGEIPGSDITPYFTVISSAWEEWNDCLATAESRFDRFDCAEETDMEQAVSDLYNALS